MAIYKLNVCVCVFFQIWEINKKKESQRQHLQYIHKIKPQFMLQFSHTVRINICKKNNNQKCQTNLMKSFTLKLKKEFKIKINSTKSKTMPIHKNVSMKNINDIEMKLGFSHTEKRIENQN